MLPLFVTVSACGAPEEQRPQFATEEVPSDPCSATTTAPVERPLTGDATPAVRDAVAGATWVLYAEIGEMEPAGAGRTTLTLRPRRVLTGPCEPVAMVAVRTSHERPISAGGVAIFLLDDARPPHVIGEPGALRVPEVEAAFDVSLAPAQLAPLPEQPAPTTAGRGSSG